MNDLGQLSTLAIYGAMACYSIAMVAFGIDLSGLRDGGAPGRARRAAGIAMATTTLGAAIHLVGIVLRGVAAGRVPWANMYEFSIVFSFITVAIFLGLQVKRDLRFLGAIVVTPVLLSLGLAVSVFYLAADGVPPALDSYWLVIHVSVATIATGVLSVAAVISAVQLGKERSELAPQAVATAPRTEEVLAPAGVGGRAEGPSDGAGATGTAGGTGGTDQVTQATGGRGFWGRLAETLPASAELERLAYRLNAVGFLLWTFTLVAGAIWAEHAWGRAWGWDPKEVWTFVIWVTYAAYLHARATRGWDGRKAAYFCLVGFALILVNYFVVNTLFVGNHSYSGL